MLVKDLIFEHGSPFSGEFRIKFPRVSTARNGSPFISLTIGDMTGFLKSYIWMNAYDGPQDLADNDRVAVSGRLREFNDQWIAVINRAERLDNIQQPISLVPAWWSPTHSLLPKLHDLVAGISTVPLQAFLNGVFGDDTISRPFVTVPGSLAHHHNIGGGLLRHSLECAEIVKAIPLFPKKDIDLGTVAALLHDVGKIRTLARGSKSNGSCFLLNHDALTLEVIGPYLKQLDEEWPDGGSALRYLLTWKNHKYRPFPLMTIAEAVISADRISSGLDREHAAFLNLPPWRNMSEPGPRQGFWRPNLACDNTSIAKAAGDAFGKFLALGIAILIGIEVSISVGVDTGLLPTKGVLLPFISYGGNSLIMHCLAIGILLNISSWRPPTDSDTLHRAVHRPWV